MSEVTSVRRMVHVMQSLPECLMPHTYRNERLSLLPRLRPQPDPEPPQYRAGEAGAGPAPGCPGDGHRLPGAGRPVLRHQRLPRAARAQRGLRHRHQAGQPRPEGHRPDRRRRHGHRRRRTWLNAARRNIGLTVLVMNNFNFGMTGGEHSVTTPPGGVTATTRDGNLERPLDICATVGGERRGLRLARDRVRPGAARRHRRGGPERMLRRCWTSGSCAPRTTCRTTMFSRKACWRRARRWAWLQGCCTGRNGPSTPARVLRRRTRASAGQAGPAPRAPARAVRFGPRSRVPAGDRRLRGRQGALDRPHDRARPRSSPACGPRSRTITR